MPDDADLKRRMDLRQPALVAALQALYGAHPDFGGWLAAFLDRICLLAAARPERLRAHDRACEADPGWFLRPEMLGYSCYVDRFAGTLLGLLRRIPYLQGLGIRYLHLLPFWNVADGDNDGGFAVSDYRSVAPRFGRLSDVATLADALHDAGITLCADLVLNHTAETHPWALAARAGDPAYRAYYHVLPDRAAVDAYEAHLGQVFPQTAPGNFTHVPEMGGWVWTTFYPFQWDLNYANPAVFAEMADVIMTLANLGVGAFRLDSAAFLWKRLGTDCRSQPETHLVMRALRAMIDIFAPSVLLKSEVIAPVADAAAYFGTDAFPECHLAYHAGLMTAGWAALAEENAGMCRSVLEAVPALPENAGWITYVRCHDDIGWQPLAPQARSAETGWDAGSVQRRLRKISDFYTEGESFARGVAFQSGAGDAAHGINGMAASLVGLEGADSADKIESAVARLVLLYGLAFASGGLPVIYMGDELGQMNDDGFRGDRLRAHEGRWLHRPAFDEDAAAMSDDPGCVAGRVRANLLKLGFARKHLPDYAPAAVPRLLAQADTAVLAFARGAGMIGLFNFSARPARAAIPGDAAWRDVLNNGMVRGSEMTLPAYGMAWLIEEPA